MKKPFAAIVLLSIFLLQVRGWSQQEMETPSQKTKEAIERFQKAPGSARKGLRALKEGAKEKLEAALQPKKSSEVQTGSIVLPSQKPARPDGPRYSAAQKRDPFRPFILESPKVTRRPRENLSPLERYELSQLRLVGVIWDIDDPRAMVEDTAGLGYIVQIGTPIGSNEGKIKAIRPSELVIEESYVDFYGATKTREIKIKLPSE